MMDRHPHPIAALPVAEPCPSCGGAGVLMAPHGVEPTNTETWRDWLPPGSDPPNPSDLYTRDQLAERIQSFGHNVSRGDLRFWEYRGILPRTVCQWHKGAVRTTYPLWMADLAIYVRSLQDKGYTLRQIPPLVRSHAQVMLGTRRANGATTD